jgi:sugar transferase (PEP-CTERM/EpsH1 system associated)
MPFPPDKGDKIRSCWELTQLAARHEVDLFCFYDDAEDKKHIPALRALCRSCYAERLSWTASRARALSALASGRPFTLGYFLSPEMKRRVAQAIRERCYDLAFVFCSSMGPYVQEFPQLPRILDMVDVDSDKWAQYAAQSSSPLAWLWQMESRRLAAYEATLVGESAATLVSTETEAAVLRGIAPRGTVRVLENPVNLDAFDPQVISIPDSIRALQPYVVFTGQMDYRPNVDAVAYFARDIFPLLKGQHRDLRFVIAGRNPAPEVRALGSDPNVHVTGTVADLRPFLGGAVAAVAPLRIARGVQNKILEALAMGVPVVASRRAAAGLPGELAAHVAAEDEPQRFAQALSGILQAGRPAPVATLRSALLGYCSKLDLEKKLDAAIGEAVQDLRRPAAETRSQEGEAVRPVTASSR